MYNYQEVIKKHFAFAQNQDYVGSLKIIHSTLNDLESTALENTHFHSMFPESANAQPASVNPGPSTSSNRG